YEEHRFHAIGSGSGFARGALKKLWRADLDTDAAITVAVEALFDASDDDSATAGPDFVRQIAPTIFTVDLDEGVTEIDSTAARAGHEPGTVLRLARTAGEGPGRFRPQGHRAWSLGRGDALRRGHPAAGREPVTDSAQDRRDLRPDRVRRRRQVQRVRNPATG